MKFHLTVLLGLIGFANLNGQDFELKSSVDIYRDVQELERGLRVLYLAAHPDDENTRLISWLENDQHVRTAYLSLTRGQGGQNLIGDEKGDALGVLRTYELLEARKVDGGEQFFARAVDFGYSKSATESFEKWGKEEVLKDVVYVIRKYRPHVIITRFPPTERAGHGHHEASALLAEEAFDLAIDLNVYPTQVAELGVWQPQALYWNASAWWDKELENLDAEGLLKKQMHRVNIGVYSDLRGEAMNEIASMARSKHRCQAFGTTRARGVQNEYLQFMKGTFDENFLDGLDGIWSRSAEHKAALKELVEGWNFTSNQANLESLTQNFDRKLGQRSMWAEERDMRWIQDQNNEIKLRLSGVRVEVYSKEDQVITRSSFPVMVEVFNSSNEPREVTIKHTGIDTVIDAAPGQMVVWESSLSAPRNVSNPLWLREQKEGALYKLEDNCDIGKPFETDMQIGYAVKVDGRYLRGMSTLHRRWRDRSIGEIIEPMIYSNPVTLSSSSHSLIIAEGSTKTFSVQVNAHSDMDDLLLNARAEGWIVEYSGEPFSLKNGQSKVFDIKVKASNSKATSLELSVERAGEKYGHYQKVISYDHVPAIALHEKAVVQLIPLSLSMDESKRILYIEGSGDEIDESLASLGYDVDKKSINGMTPEELKAYDAVITGIRAFNRNEELASNVDLLHDYVEGGGNMIVMYNTTYDLKVEQIGPQPLTLSRKRVTEEDSEVSLLDAENKVFAVPNKITNADWNGWVQERGLYFAGEWDKSYTPLIGWHDQEEEDVTGGLLLAHHGEGSFFYSGVSFFRQLPAGVSGAYRLLVNMIEYKQ
ncbi:MAG: hypothetical protein HOH53_02785 [Flavobacteriales bacterium]|mgnify:FL=1|nr:hypothetical protein [Flavobacteriales bacterium]